MWLEEGLKYTDKEKVYQMIKLSNGGIKIKVGGNPVSFFFNSSCYELEKEGRIVGDEKFFSSKITWRLPTDREKVLFEKKQAKILRKNRKDKISKINSNQDV